MSAISDYEALTLKMCKDEAERLGVSLTDLLLNKLIFALENLEVTTINAADII